MATRRFPGIPSLLRVLNDRAALELLLHNGPMTRAELAAETSLSKVTASQMVERLEARGLVTVVGSRPGGRGPNATVYSVVPGYAYVVGVDVGPRTVTAALADLTGSVCGRVRIDTGDGDDPVQVVHRAVFDVVEAADVPQDRIRRIVCGTPGLVEPDSGDLGFSWELPSWHHGLRAALTEDLKRPVVFENDVNLAAVAEHRDGAAGGVDDFVYVWFSRGLGVGVILNGRLHRGATGGAGEIGYLPVPGGPLPSGSVARRAKGSFQQLAGADIVRNLARDFGFDRVNGAKAVKAAVAAGADGEAFLDELASRMALGVASVSVVLDPGLVVLGGSVGYAGGEALATRVAAQVGKLAPVRPRVVVGTVPEDPVMRGAMFVGLDAVREEIFDEEA